MKIFTIGFTKKSAEVFFTSLANAGVKRLLDVRLNNVSQLAGFTKKNDLRYFTKAICQIDYQHLPELAPTQEMLETYKKKKGDCKGANNEKGRPQGFAPTVVLLCSLYC